MHVRNSKTHDMQFLQPKEGIHYEYDVVMDVDSIEHPAKF